MRLVRNSPKVDYSSFKSDNKVTIPQGTISLSSSSQAISSLGTTATSLLHHLTPYNKLGMSWKVMSEVYQSVAQGEPMVHVRFRFLSISREKIQNAKVEKQPTVHAVRIEEPNHRTADFSSKLCWTRKL
ncbi:hypothetical protein SAY86_031373 [Trapa natans]|uniref:Uncharacterized protein n=1 Tax=Trapa natans TaxID=22666 RepID=A0AAN7M7H9_TRANT|nr:hypothetical protein SAY86_031373 [Trapa natans]